MYGGENKSLDFILESIYVFASAVGGGGGDNMIFPSLGIGVLLL